MDVLHHNPSLSVFMSFVLAFSFFACPAIADITPATLEATLHRGECIEETKSVTVAEIPPKVDVVFAFDLTNSMDEIINTAKMKAGEIITELETATGVSIQYGVMSYMDYPDSYSSCGYSKLYGNAGECGDYAYSLDQSITDDTPAITGAINALTLGCGGDGPQDYTRIFHESYADPSVGWRTGAKRILVNFGDHVPHDCDLNEGVPGKSGVLTTGGDPGRDEIMGTADDLDLQTVLLEMADNGVVLLESHTTDYASKYWNYWTDLTGGSRFTTTSANLVDKVVNAILSALKTPQVCGLHLKGVAPYNTWLTSDPNSYACFSPPATKIFNATICVPDDATEGPNVFTVNAFDENNVSYGEQIVSIEVVTCVEDARICELDDDEIEVLPPPGYAAWNIAGARITRLKGIPLNIPIPASEIESDDDDCVELEFEDLPVELEDGVEVCIELELNDGRVACEVCATGNDDDD